MNKMFILAKSKENKFVVYCPSIYGSKTWGSNHHDSIVKKRKKWYFEDWIAGNQYIDGALMFSKINVVLETSDINEILKYVFKVNPQEIKHILFDIYCLIKEFILFSAFFDFGNLNIYEELLLKINDSN